jgi:hypothetical protein
MLLLRAGWVIKRRADAFTKEPTFASTTKCFNWMRVMGMLLINEF